MQKLSPRVPVDNFTNDPPDSVTNIETLQKQSKQYKKTKKKRLIY